MGDGPFNGQATYYDLDAGLTACGKQYSNNDFVCALNSQQFDPYTPGGNPNNNTQCGRQIQITGPVGTTNVTVVDKLPSGQYGDLDLSPAAFRHIAGSLDAGRVNITWNFV
ncbi:unnamed protein product [Adineta steineri]|uniref:RlpA-like protein double-psi beta-barrel domain-containing protein n=1 Tax=Adineta steineri TaxID=433720 RepID=A0A819Y631_9BILA|nr:unnamed protein product [Adineta steineri]CAF4153373.1 unnamed protein product [Adineta steineri]